MKIDKERIICFIVALILATLCAVVGIALERGISP